MTKVTTADVIDRLRNGERFPAANQTYRAPEQVEMRGSAADVKSIKVHGRLLTRGVVEDPNLGPVVFDFGSMTIPKKLALDDSHGMEIGYCRVEQTEYGLEYDGVITPNHENIQHGSNRIAYNFRSDIPQQSSLDWRGSYDAGVIPEGASAVVNGAEVRGPCLVLMNTTARAVAICKAGVDQTTSVSAQLNAEPQLAPLPRKIIEMGVVKQGQMAENREPRTESRAAQPDNNGQQNAISSQEKIMDKPAITPAAETPAPTQQNAVAGTVPVKTEPTLMQQNALGDAARGELVKVVRKAIEACEKHGHESCKYAADAGKTAADAIEGGRKNAVEECYEAAHMFRSCALELAKGDGDDKTKDVVFAALQASLALGNSAGYSLSLYSETEHRILSKATGQSKAMPVAIVGEDPKLKEVLQQFAELQKAHTDLTTAHAATVVEREHIHSQLSTLNSQLPVLTKERDEMKQQYAALAEEYKKATEERDAGASKIISLEDRLKKMGGGAPPVPNAPVSPGGATQELSWPQCLAAAEKDLRAKDPEATEAQVYAHACRKFPEALKKVRIVKEAGK